MTLTCCIAHGWGIYFFLADEGMVGGSNWTRRGSYLTASKNTVTEQQQQQHNEKLTGC